MKAKPIQSGLIYKPDDDAPVTPERRKVLDRVIPGSRVLEIGSHGGHFSKLLLERGCSVTAVELDPDAARLVRIVGPEVIAGDIEDPSVLDQLDGRQYDFILFMHVLEHLVDPWRILNRCRDLLSASGVLIALLPNVASWRIRKDLFFKGNFEYTDVGILDRTHLRFFTIDSGKELFKRSGYRVGDPEVLDTSVPLEVRLRRMFGTAVSRPWHRWMVRHYPNLCADILYFEAHPL